MEDSPQQEITILHIFLLLLNFSKGNAAYKPNPFSLGQPGARKESAMQQCPHVHVFGCPNAWAIVCMPLNVCKYMKLHVFVYEHVYTVCEYVFESCECICMHVHCAGLFMHGYMNVHTYMHGCVCM